MRKDVTISISGVHIEDVEGGSANEPIEIVAPATYFFKNGKHYILYEEAEEGVSNVTKNQIKITRDVKIELRKKGTHTTNMVFEKGKASAANYQTPFGEIALGVHTTEMKVQEDKDRIVADIEYRLVADEQHVSDCKLAICIQNNETSV